MADETPTRSASSRGTRTTRTTRGRTSRGGSSTSRGESNASGDPRVVGRRPAKKAADGEKPQLSTTRRRPAAKTDEKAERTPRRRPAAETDEKAERTPRRRPAAETEEKTERTLRRRRPAAETEEKAARTTRRRPAAETEEKTERTPAARTPRRRPTTAAGSRSRSAASKTAADAPAEEKAEATTTTKRTTRRRSTQAVTADPASADVPVNPAAPARVARAAAVVSDEAPKSIEELGQAIVEVRRAIDDLGTRIETSTKRAKVGVFVDVPNVLYGADHLDGTINMGKLLDYLVGGRDVVRATAYSPVSDDPSEPVERQRFVAPFVPHGYRIVTKPLKRFADGSIKGNFDVEMAIDMVTMAERLDVVSVVSGDSDFARLVEVIQGRGVRVEVVAFAGSTSVEMRSLADRYIELGAIYDQISD
jgi:uncharacterized LabA/DUF88 family protein